VTSVGHVIAVRGVSFHLHASGAASYDALTAYFSSKLANVMFASALARRYPRLQACSVHPGIVDSGLWRHAPSVLQLIVAMVFQKPRDAAHNIVHCCVDAGVGGGRYYADEAVGVPLALARDSLHQDVLWAASCAAVMDFLQQRKHPWLASPRTDMFKTP
jgi:NAD(P)-dependent dehydrogenase (short-subunit alcohol dehydrogenase family)